MAGHDLREPLQVIMTTYSWLAQQRGNGRERRYIERGELAIAQLTQELDHLVDALRLNGWAGGVKLMPVAIEPLVAELRRENREIAAQKGLQFRFPATRAAVMSDAVLLKGILRNLIRNAMKYTPAGGRILVGCRRLGPLVRVEVHDTGIGFAADHLSKVFEAFQRLESTEVDGLGLGLFVVRRAAELLGHRIQVRSVVGRGSCFSIVMNAATIMTEVS
jgi:signal transduction histidine kinase